MTGRTEMSLRFVTFLLCFCHLQLRARSLPVVSVRGCVFPECSLALSPLLLSPPLLSPPLLPSHLTHIKAKLSPNHVASDAYSCTLVHFKKIIMSGGLLSWHPRRLQNYVKPTTVLLAHLSGIWNEHHIRYQYSESTTTQDS